MPAKNFMWIGAVRDPSFFFFFSIPSGIGTEKAKEVRAYLQENKDNTANIIISSNGGDQFLAERMIGLLEPYKSRITVEVVGLAASAGASLAAGVGHETYVRKTSTLMIHAPTTGTEGNKLDHENALALFENGHKKLRSIFEDTKLTKADLDSVFDEYKEMWLTADEAVKKGLASKILEPDEKVDKVIQDAIEEAEEDDDMEALIAHFPVEKLTEVLGGRLAAKYVSNNSSTTEDEVSEEEKKALEAKLAAAEAKVEALEANVTTLKASNKSLQDKLDEQEKNAAEVKYTAAVEAAVAKKAIADTPEERKKWMDLMDKGGDPVMEALASIQPHPALGAEVGSGADKPTPTGKSGMTIADVPANVVAAYKANVKDITDEQIIAYWEADNGESN